METIKKAGRPLKHGERKVSITVRALLMDHQRIKHIAKCEHDPLVILRSDENKALRLEVDKLKKQNYELAVEVAGLKEVLG